MLRSIVYSYSYVLMMSGDKHGTVDITPVQLGEHMLKSSTKNATRVYRVYKSHVYQEKEVRFGQSSET